LVFLWFGFFVVWFFGGLVFCIILGHINTMFIKNAKSFWLKAHS